MKPNPGGASTGSTSPSSELTMPQDDIGDRVQMKVTTIFFAKKCHFRKNGLDFDEMNQQKKYFAQ